MADPFIGEIRMFAGNFAPRGWQFCNGQLLAISQWSAVFALLGTTYGGNGQTTFGLPDLRGRAPLHWGTGNGLSPYSLGQVGGVENVTLLSTQMPAHTHALNANTGLGEATTPTGNVPAMVGDPNAGTTYSAYSPMANTAMGATAIGAAGSSQPHSNLQPYLCVSFIIALEGIFPSRN